LTWRAIHFILDVDQKLLEDDEAEFREGPLKVRKTCGFWSREKKKGFCQRDQWGVGQFWCCEL
jgi:hypothetical protein